MDKPGYVWFNNVNGGKIMKIHKWLLVMVLCFVAGCSDSKSAEGVYKQALEDMNNDVYYVKTESKIYLHDQLTNSLQIEQVKEGEGKLKAIIRNESYPENTLTVTTVIDGLEQHSLEDNKIDNTKNYTFTKLEQKSVETAFFQNALESFSLPEAESRIEKSGDSQKLHFLYIDKNDEGKKVYKQEYIITIKDTYIVEIENRSYPNGEDTLSQRTVITYSDFNKHKSMNTTSLIKEVKAYEK